MYKLLLCLRYLRTRWIALASIISVTLGVATLIVVNSVMSGFTTEMRDRLHGILSDVVFESHSLGGFSDVEAHTAKIREVLGDDLEGITATVHVPAMLNFQFRGRWVTRQVNLIGIDEATYASVSDFSKYLMHPENQKQLSFRLREDGYNERIPDNPGWEHRRARVEQERAFYQKQQPAKRPGSVEQAQGDGNSYVTDTNRDPFATQFYREGPPVIDPNAKQGELFDEAKEQYSGMILGIGITTIRRANDEGEVEDFFLCKPGDDVKITLPTTGTPPQAVSETFTIVDMYESKMSEYDSSFAFVPLPKLQQLRGMIDPQSGRRAVTSIQLKLREGADLAAVADKLRAEFPSEVYPYRIQTWMEMQGPLLQAVQMETTVLNILLFMIIAVAGFGILATFYMIVVEKTKDIGVLKSLGAPNRGVMAIFLSYGLSLGMVGSGVGMVLGVVFVININRIAAGLEYVTGQEVFDPAIYYFREIPTILSPWTISWIVVGAMLIAVLASVLPALRAARLHPVEALRYE